MSNITKNGRESRDSKTVVGLLEGREEKNQLMPAAVRVMPLRPKLVLADPVQQESFDVQELASEAADALEAYRRAPWRQLTERTRLAKLRQAIELLNRVDELEEGRIPTSI